MSDIIDYGHQLTTALVLLTKPKLENTQYDPLVRSEKDSTAIGYQHIYMTDLEPSTRLQFVFLNEDYPGFTVDNALLKDKPILTPVQAREEVMDAFTVHPDAKVVKYIQELFEFYEPEEGVEVRIIPWVEELQSIQENNEFAGLAGLFFPVIHIHLKDIDWSVTVRCEPVLDIKDKQDN